MAKNSSSGGSSGQQLADYSASQEGMLNLAQQYSQQRMAVWADEMSSLKETWDAFAQEWQGSLGDMSDQALNKFEEISANGSAAASQISQVWGSSLTDLSSQVDDWGEHFIQTLEKVAAAWVGAGGSSGGGSGGGILGLVGDVVDFGGLFHQGGLVTAHQGMVVSPETIMRDEQLILAQSGEGILPRDSMARLGETNFEALRSGRFELAPAGGAPNYNITIQMQGSGATGRDWDRMVQRHLLPVLQQESNRRW
jgi:hypothetical protein